MVSNTGNCPYCTRDIDGSVQLETISLDGIEGLKVVVDAQDGVLSIGIITEQNTKARELFHKHSVAFKTDAKFCPYCGKQLIRTDASDKSYDYIIDDIEDDFSDDSNDNQVWEEENIEEIESDIDSFDDIDYADDNDSFTDEDIGIDDETSGLVIDMEEDDPTEGFNESSDSHTVVSNMPSHFDVDTAVDEALFMMGLNPYENYDVDVVIDNDI